MATFDAGKAVDPMAYDFTTVEGGKGKGVVPEPSTAAMKTFQKRFTRLMAEAAKLDVSDDALKTMSGEDLAKLQQDGDRLSDEIDQAVATLCQNTPSVEEVSSLPFRVKTAFSRWLMDQFSPEGGASGTTK